MSLILDCCAGKTLYVVGLGKTGLQTVSALQAGGATVLAWDDNPTSQETALKENIQLCAPDNVNWNTLDSLMLSPGIAHLHPKAHRSAELAQQHDVEIICDIELFIRQFPHARIVAITGTNGKSTTSALMHHILHEAKRPVQIGGNFGVPVLSLTPPSRDDIIVLELSSYQLERIPSLSAHIAILLNISPDHLERHGGMAGYVAAKSRIFEGQKQDGLAIIGTDDDRSIGILEAVATKSNPCLPISSQHALSGGVFIDDAKLMDAIGRDAEQANEVLDLRIATTLPGHHNHQNAAAVYAACRHLGLPSKIIGDAICSFPGLAHRQQMVAILDNVAYVNDSKATNAEATARALTCYPSIFWLAGGQEKQGGYALLDKMITNVKKAYFFGEGQANLARHFHGQFPVECFSRLDEALKAASIDAKKADDQNPVVLLSPACASWDQYASFEARGDDFVNSVKALPSDQSKILI